jgi:hypothetical protein
MKRLLFIFAFLPLAFLSNAQEIKFTAVSSHSKIGVGEQFRITFTVNTNASGFQSPDLSDFNVLSGPNQSSSVQIVNGSFAQNLSYYFILTAKKEGKYTINPAVITVGNGRIQSNSLIIEVGKSSQRNNQSAGNNGQTQANSSQSGSLGDKIFIRAIVNKSSVFLGEAVSVTYKIYSKYNQINFSDLRFPTFNGFYTEDVPMGKNDKLEVEEYNGTNWYTAELKKSLLLPQKSGKLDIPSLEATCVVRERTQGGQNFFDQFFGGGYRDVSVKVKSNPHVLDVIAHPNNGKPADFNGAVGNFDIKAEVDKSDIKSGDAITYKLEISGTGNLKLIEAPKLEFPVEFEAYDPQVKDNIRIGESGISGSRTFEYLLIPRAGGNYKLGPFTYSFFSTSRKGYESTTLPAIDIKVAKSAGDQVVSGRSSPGSSPKQLASDIKFIKTSTPDLEPIKTKPFFLSVPFYALSAVPPFALVLLLVVRRRQADRSSNKLFYRQKQAGGMAHKRLKHAGELLKTNKKEDFYEEIFRAVYGYLSDKLQIPQAQLNKEFIAEKLHSKKVPQQDIQELERLLGACEFARFAPGAESNMTSVFNETQVLITTLEKYLK